MTHEKICGIIAIVGGAIAKLVGGFDYTLKAMILLMVIDILCGVVCAGFFKVSKYDKKGITSNALFKGILRKITALMLVAIAVVIDNVLGIDYVRNGVVIYFIATEGISVLENMISIGIPVPKVILRLLENIKETAETDLNQDQTSDFDSNKTGR